MPEDILVSKEIITFNRTIFKKGNFITFCEMFPLEVKREMKQYPVINGIITDVTDNVVKVIDGTGRTRSIDIESLVNPHEYRPYVKYKILGYEEILLNAEEKQ